MRRLGALTITAATAAMLACSAISAEAARPHTHAAPVLVLDGGKVERRLERFAGPDQLPGTTRVATATARAHAAAKRPPRGRATRQALDALLDSGQIDQATHDTRLDNLNQTLQSYRTLTGRRQLELGAVIDNTDAMATDAQLTPSRLTAVFATLDANRTWWTTGPLLKNGARVSTQGSQVIWQYYSGQGIQLQMLANFGKANALWSGRRTITLRKLLSELTPMAADRGGYPAFEYYFHFGEGDPPWTSSISQGTAVQALARAGQLLADPSLIQLGEAALGAFEQPPPVGIRKDTDQGPFYLIYSFAPNLLVINAHLQAVVGLHDYAEIAGSARGQSLFQQGDAEAQAVLPSYDTGSWSMYDQNHESDLNYHDLVTTFLRNLCTRTSTPIYCDTAGRFTADRSASPSAYPTTRRIRAGAPARLGFSVNKISRVGVVVMQGTRTVFSTSALVGHGTRVFTWARPASPGMYQVRVRATDLAGNVSSAREQDLEILPPRPKRKPKSARR
jgi:D-glucuronyl C5-epimerase C-terminus